MVLHAAASKHVPLLQEHLRQAFRNNVLATRTLANPAGTINAQGRIVLSASAADLVAETGSVGWAEWWDSAGSVMAAGTVTDQAGSGDFKLAGTAGTTIYQGGRVLLDDVILG